MVHKAANTVLDSGMNKVKQNKPGIHKYSSSSSWLDDYNKNVDEMHSQVDSYHDLIDKEIMLSELRAQAAQERISNLQEQEELERQREEMLLHQEQLRQIELEKARAEVEKTKAEIKAVKRAAAPQQVVTAEPKPSIKQKVSTLGKKIAGVIGAAAGRPELAVAALETEIKEKPKKKVKYVKPKYTPEGELVYGSWVE